MFRTQKEIFFGVVPVRPHPFHAQAAQKSQLLLAIEHPETR